MGDLIDTQLEFKQKEETSTLKFGFSLNMFDINSAFLASRSKASSLGILVANAEATHPYLKSGKIFCSVVKNVSASQISPAHCSFRNRC